jgi:P4 family phage/plasmid primase-like protien
MIQNSNDSNNYNIFNFLSEHIVENGQVHTHTSICNPKGAFFIKSFEMDTFYELYEEALFKGKELHITEKHEEISPIVIDLDFRYEFDLNDRKHTIEHIKKILELYVNEISSTFEIEKDDSKMTAFIFERNETYKSKGFTKDGIHILFPFIVSYAVPQYHIRENILKKIGDILCDLELKNIIPDVVDRAVISQNNWLLYGSNKDKPKNNPYELTYIFNGKIEEISIEDYFGDSTPSLPRFFSIRGKKTNELIKIRDEKISILDSMNKKKSVKLKLMSYVNYDVLKIKELVSMLNEERADNYSQWLEVGWVLHNIDPNSQELLNLWIEFSSKSSKFKEGECEKLWENSKPEGLSIASLHYWAKIDNKKKYEEFKNKDIDKFIESSIKSQSNYDVALVLYKMHEYDFIFSDNEWYTYKNHRWNKETDGMSLRQLISTKLCEKYMFLMSSYNKVISNHELSDEEKEEYKKKNIVILEVIKKLKTTSFKDNVMRECKELFCNKDFIKKIDTNTYLIGFNNGVYDLKKGELRDGRPDDYIEMTTEIDKIDFDENHEEWNSLRHFIETVFVDEDVRTYFMTYLASCLQGHNAEEKFRIWTGSGCHAYDTEIMMFNGTLKKVQNIVIGDKLMGDNCTERNVIELKRGIGKMYKFFGKDFDSFIVNDEHILCLKEKYSNQVLEISVKNFLLNNEYKNNKYFLYDKNNILYDFSIKELEKDNFYGFELDGNHRYVMGNNIITHNSNGKSKILELFVHSIGTYAIKFPITLLTGKRAQSNACTPEVVQSKGKRFGYFEEPSENERINAGLLKEFTGGDKIKARALHKEPIEFKPQFKLALLCNDMPEVPPNDSGTWRRMEVIEFKSKFCENPKESHEFPIDRNLSEKLKIWKELFIALLLDNYYVRYKKYGIKVPLEVIKFTLEYQKQCDLYTDFILENLEDTKENSQIIDITSLYDEFKVWYENTFSNHKYPSKVEFKRYLKKKYGSKRVDNNNIKGFKFKSNDSNNISQKKIIEEEIPLVNINEPLSTGY